MNWEQILDSSLIGSLVGTTIAGLVAIGVMRSQLKNDRKVRRKQELEVILKIGSTSISWTQKS